MAKKNAYDKNIKGHIKTRDVYKDVLNHEKLDAKSEQIALDNKKLHIKKIRENKRAGK